MRTARVLGEQTAEAHFYHVMSRAIEGRQTDGTLADTSFTASYDSGDRISTWARADTHLSARETQSWSYDDAGNCPGGVRRDLPKGCRQSRAASAAKQWNSTTIDGSTQSRTHNPSDETTEVGSANLAHDIRGNLLDDQDGRDFERDLDNRLRAVDNDVAPSGPHPLEPVR